jgi:4-hydroxybenzoate polyprenyltransferase
MRFDKPVGILLLWYPTAWALWLANQGRPPILLVSYFFFGTIIMRSAGCVINDIADRKIDKHIRRTHLRPLTAGEITLYEAIILFSLLLIIAFFIVLLLPVKCLYWSVLALIITIIYPFCKRFFEAPQLVLGLAFSMGIPMAYAASGIAINSLVIELMLLNFAWIVAYDTMYAMADREDDLKIGVKSMAILLGEYDRLMILLLELFLHSGWLIVAKDIHASRLFYGFWTVASIVLIYQQRLLRERDPISCFHAFSSNAWYGLLMWAALS